LQSLENSGELGNWWWSQLPNSSKDPCYGVRRHEPTAGFCSGVRHSLTSNSSSLLPNAKLLAQKWAYFYASLSPLQLAYCFPPKLFVFLFI
jgi:hypothetical protein